MSDATELMKALEEAKALVGQRAATLVTTVLFLAIGGPIALGLGVGIGMSICVGLLKLFRIIG